MIYTIKAWYDSAGQGTFTADALTRKDALDKAVGLNDQGFQHIILTNAAGRDFTLAEFIAFCSDPALAPSDVMTEAGPGSPGG